MTEFDQLHEDVGAYVLGALDEDEAKAFELHLEGCAECRTEVARLGRAVDALPRSVEPLAAPAGLKTSLMEAVREEAPAPKVRAPRRRLLPSLRLTPPLAWASAAFLLAVGIGAGFGLGRTIGNDGTRSIQASVNNPQTARAAGNLTVSDGGKDGAILHVSGLPSAGAHVYQAWLRRGREIVPQPTFEVGQDGVGAVAVPDDLKGADEVIVTREPRGGSRAPTGPAVMTVRL